MARRPRPVPGKPDVMGRPGLPAGLVAEKVRSQGGLCAVCNVRPATHVDHDHSLARLHPHPEASYCRRCIRGITCAQCNSVLGFADDRPEVLEAAATYVRLWTLARRENRL